MSKERVVPIDGTITGQKGVQEAQQEEVLALHPISGEEKEAIQREWQGLVRTPTGFWQGEEGIEHAIFSIRDLVQSRLQYASDDPDFRNHVRGIRRNIFIEHGLDGMLKTVFAGSPARAFTTAFPELQFQPWEFGRVSAGFWHENSFENVGSAIRWLIEEKLGISPDEGDFRMKVMSVPWKAFEAYGLTGIRTSTDLPYWKMVQIAYPDLQVTEEDCRLMNRRPKGYWREDTVEKEAREFIQKYGALTQKLLVENKRNDLLVAIYDSYPGRLIKLKEKLGVHFRASEAMGNISPTEANSELLQFLEVEDE